MRGGGKENTDDNGAAADVDGYGDDDNDGGSGHKYRDDNIYKICGYSLK